VISTCIGFSYTNFRECRKLSYKYEPHRLHYLQRALLKKLSHPNITEVGNKAGMLYKKELGYVKCDTFNVFSYTGTDYNKPKLNIKCSLCRILFLLWI